MEIHISKNTRPEKQANKKFPHPRTRYNNEQEKSFVYEPIKGN